MRYSLTQPPGHTLFSESTKMADIIMSNSSLLSVMMRFNIPLGFGEKNVKEVCNAYQVNETLFLLICNVYTFSQYIPQKEELALLDLEALVDYLRASHHFYTYKEIPEIAQQMEIMGKCCGDLNHKLLTKFFFEYKSEIIKHFQYEEQVVYPYIASLIDGEVRGAFGIHQYEENHEHIEDKLNDLKNIIIKYLPSECESSSRVELLKELFMFEEELNSHSLIEERILIPYVEQLEKERI